MGKGKRSRPKFLAKKLREIRKRMELSQNEMLKRVGLEGKFSREELSAYERGVREPPLSVLLSYSKTCLIWVNALIDDELDLPNTFYTTEMQAGKKRGSSKSRRT